MACPELNCSLTPECDLKWKLSTDYTGTITDASGNIVATAITANKLELCSNVVTFSELECPENLNRIILGIPLVFVKKCHMYSVVIPAISDGPLDPTQFPDIIEVKDGATGGQMNLFPIGIQIANGYMYVVIDVSNRTDPESLTLCFNVFCFEITKKIVPCGCELKCKPITWTYGYDSLIPPQP